MNLTSSRAVVIGSSGGIGKALADQLEARGHEVVRLARPGLDFADEASIAAAAARVGAPVGLVLVASGILHDETMQPEKSLRDLDARRLLHYFAVNCVGPALVAKHFLPLLPQTGRSIFAALSARVGSISDNRIGGWYGYRASKAALNQLIRTLAIELVRRNPETMCVGLHPGTVNTKLSQPFQRNVNRLFTPTESADHLLGVLAALTPQQSGRCFAWDGREIEP